MRVERDIRDARERRRDDRQQQRPHDLPEERAAREQTRLERAREERAKLAEILLPHQMKRLNEIYVQRAGTAALRDEEIASQLGINDSQKAQIAKINDDFQAKRGPDDRYVTAKLRALWDTKKIHKGGFYHDGRFATLSEMVDHYETHLRLNLTASEKHALIEYLKSL